MVRRLFSWYATGMYSIEQLIKMMHDYGFSSPRSDGKLSKSTLYSLLTNPIYYGEFVWNGVLYKGTYEPLISKELFDKVQRLLDKGRSHSSPQKHEWSYQGMLVCGVCGCAMVAEKKKGKYIYYHCTQYHGKCPGGKSIREEVLDEQFADLVNKLEFDDDILEWLSSVLQASCSTEREHLEQLIFQLKGNRQKIENRLENLYVDKLDGSITEEKYKSLERKFSADLAEIDEKIHRHESAKSALIGDKDRIRTLAQNAALLFSRQNANERSKLIKLLISQSPVINGKIAENGRMFLKLISGN